MLKRFFCVLFCMILCLPAGAAPAETIEEVLLEFMDIYDLDESNFSVSYYNEKNEESYSFNDKAFVPMGKLWTLPLHMYFYEEEINGNFAPEKIDPENLQELTIADKTLEECRYHSMILGDENVSLSMMSHIGTIMQYLQVVNERYGRIDMEELPVEFWDGKVYSVEFMMNCIRLVSAQPERFGDLMANFRMAQKADAFADGSVPYLVVQIRGSENGYVTAAAEVSAHQPYLLVASVADSVGGDIVLSALNETISDYVKRGAGEAEEKVDETLPTTQTPNYYVGQERVTDNGDLTRWLLVAFAVAATVALVGGVILMILRSKHERR